MRLVSFDVSHLKGATVHRKQARYKRWVSEATIPRPAWSAFDGCDLIAIGGCGELRFAADVPGHAGEGAWLLFMDKVRPRHFLWIVRMLREKLRERAADDPLLYIDIDPAYAEAGRLARLLGFSSVGIVTFEDGRSLTRMIADV